MEAWRHAVAHDHDLRAARKRGDETMRSSLGALNNVEAYERAY